METPGARADHVARSDGGFRPMTTASASLALKRREEAAPDPSDRLHDLYESHSRGVYLTALRVTGNAADAEDVLQTVFLRVFEKRIDLDASRSPGGYLRRAATNASIDLLRRKKTRGETEIEPGIDYAGEGGSRATPGKRRVLLKDRLREALTRLPPENAELFVLCYLEGYSYDELAELFDIERGTVGSRLSRTRATLREELSE